MGGAIPQLPSSSSWRGTFLLYLPRWMCSSVDKVSGVRIAYWLHVAFMTHQWRVSDKTTSHMNVVTYSFRYPSYNRCSISDEVLHTQMVTSGIRSMICSWLPDLRYIMHKGWHIWNKVNDLLMVAYLIWGTSYTKGDISGIRSMIYSYLSDLRYKHKWWHIWNKVSDTSTLRCTIYYWWHISSDVNTYTIIHLLWGLWCTHSYMFALRLVIYL
jgi:hypothetical protein